MKELTNKWIDKNCKKLGLKVCYVPLSGGEKEQTHEERDKSLVGRGKGNYEQDLAFVSRRGKEEAGGKIRQEHIGKSKRDEDPQTTEAVQIDNKGEIGR